MIVQLQTSRRFVASSTLHCAQELVPRHDAARHDLHHRARGVGGRGRGGGAGGRLDRRQPRPQQVRAVRAHRPRHRHRRRHSHSRHGLLLTRLLKYIFSIMFTIIY